VRASWMRRYLPVAVVAVAASVLPLRASALTLPAATSPTAARPSAPGLTTALEGVPRFDHVVVLVLENENFNVTWNAANAPYLNGLRNDASTTKPYGNVFADHYYATGHASLDNYIAMISGQPDQPLTGSDCLAVSLWVCAQGQLLMANGRNLADQLEEQGLSWKGYMDSMPSPCFHQEYSPTVLTPDPYQGDSQAPPAKDYADRHNPFLYFPNIVGNPSRCEAHVRPYTELAGDLVANALPHFSFITPDTCHDGHDAPCSDGSIGGMKGADNWLSEAVPPLLTYLSAHNGLLIITLDENGFSDPEMPPGCCSGGIGGVLPGFGGRIGLLALGPGLGTHKTVTTSYDHMSLLRTIESSFGMGEHLNNAAQASSMADLFAP